MIKTMRITTGWNGVPYLLLNPNEPSKKINQVVEPTIKTNKKACDGSVNRQHIMDHYGLDEPTKVSNFITKDEHK